MAFASPVNAPATAKTLDNGLKVIVQEDHSTNLVAVDVWIRAGSINETAVTNGVSHFIEHLLFKATEKRGSGKIDMEIETLGSSLEARTGRDWAHFYTIVASRYMDKSLDILADVIMHPKFQQEDIDHERQIIIDEIARRKVNPFNTLQDLIYKTAYTVHPYGLPVEGTRESISKITREMIVDYYNRLYVPENMAIVLVGDVTASEGTAAAAKAFVDFKKKPFEQTAIASEPTRTEQKRGAVKQNTQLEYIAIAYPAPSVKTRPDVYAMDVLVSYLGAGYQSWLTTDLKNGRKLAVEASSDFLTQKEPGLAIIMVSTEQGKLTDVENAIFAKIAALRTNPISENDLARAKRSLEGSYAFDVETFSGRATTLGFYESVSSFDLARTYIQNIRNVTTSDVLAAAKKYLDPDKAVVVTLGP